MSVRSDNLSYKKSIAKNAKFCPFRYEKQMDHLFSYLEKDFKKTNKVLEAGCGQGRLLFYLNAFNDHQEYVGMDYMRSNIKEAKKNLKEYPQTELLVEDFYEISKKYKKNFDISISYKTLSWLPDYEDALKELIKVTKNKIYITSLFYDGDMSFITQIHEHNKKTFSYLNTYSFPKFKNFCLKNGAKKVKSINMNLDFELKKPKNKNDLQTYAITDKNGGIIEITGNSILNWKLVIIEL